MVKFIKCECGKRYKEGNQKHFDSKEHKKYLQDEKIKKSNETHIIVHDIDKAQLMEYLHNQNKNKTKFIINDEDVSDYSFSPDDSDTSTDDSEDTKEP